MLALERLQVLAGKPCDDPRLSEIDLRSRVRRITVRATTTDGGPLTYGDVKIGALELTRGGEPFRVQGDRDGVATLVFSEPTIGFVIGARGLRTKELRNVSADVTVELEPGIPIRARLTPVAQDVLVYGRVTPVRPELELHVYATPVHRPGEAMSLGPLSPGRYELGYVLSGLERTAPLASRTIEVLDTKEAQLFEVTCTAQELAAALAHLRR
jgi:hypothetical protein